MKKTLIAYHKGLEIEVTNHWINGCTLSVNGKEIASTKKLVHLDIDEPLFSNTINTSDGAEVVKVYVDANINVKLLIEVNGKPIAKVL